MKKVRIFNVSLILLLVQYLNAQLQGDILYESFDEAKLFSRIVENTNEPRMLITHVSAEWSRTVIYFEYRPNKNVSFYIHPKISISDADSPNKLKTINIEDNYLKNSLKGLGQQYSIDLKKGDVYKFILQFPTLETDFKDAKDIKKINIYEPNEGGWFWEGVNVNLDYSKKDYDYFYVINESNNTYRLQHWNSYFTIAPGQKNKNFGDPSRNWTIFNQALTKRMNVYIDSSQESVKSFKFKSHSLLYFDQNDNIMLFEKNSPVWRRFDSGGSANSSSFDIDFELLLEYIKTGSEIYKTYRDIKKINYDSRNN